VILISITLAGILSLPSVNSAQISNITIRSSGTIANILPLHVEGRYIKDASGNTVILRGFQKPEFADDPDGIWMGNTYWNTQNVITELDAMKSWGANTIRVQQSIDSWKYNLDSPHAAIPNRQAIKELLTLAAERGMYVIFTPYRVTNYHAGGTQDDLPYPPYQESAGASDVIGSEQDFVDYWVSVVEELKIYPNVIFELWNEPNGGGAEASWFSVAQDCITAIRETGAEQLIIFQWKEGVYANLDYGSDSGSVKWIEDYSLVDTTGNLVYSTHIYRLYGGLGLYSEEESKTLWNSSYGYTYDEVKRALEIEKINWVGETLNKPLLITETGCSIAWTGTELEHELTAWNNSLTIFNEWELGYIGHWWRNIGVFRLLENDQPWLPPPTESGIIFRNALASG
jgi:hypothetical protein